MANTHEPQKVVVVTGDVTMDWNLACTRNSEGSRLAWTAEDCTRTYWQRRGAALLNRTTQHWYTAALLESPTSPDQFMVGLQKSAG